MNELTQGEKLSAIYRVCMEAKEKYYIDEGVINQILKIVTFDKHDVLDDKSN